MAEKRKYRDGPSMPDAKIGKKKPKQTGGFRVGPANLPDGAYKRKTQRIKGALIERAQIKKGWAKLKRQGKVRDEPEELPTPASMQAEKGQSREKNEMDENRINEGEEEDLSMIPHPDRQSLMDREEPKGELSEQTTEGRGPIAGHRHKPHKPKSQPFKHEYEQALKRKAEAEERRKAREEAERQRQRKIEERERFRKTMAKARTGGPNGQRKLGRESSVLLERVKKMVGDGGLA